jgi:uncharacterized membrane protein (UPF0127 family)
MRAKATGPVPKLLEALAMLALVLTVACGAGRAQPETPASAPGPAPESVPEPPPRLEQERGASAPGAPGPGTALLIFGNDTVRAEVASTPGQRSQGLMGRAEVPAGTGMLFVFEDEEVRSFWMRNTLVSLDIAFMDSEFRIVDIQQMEARSEDFYDSSEPAMYALEVPVGWLAAQGIRVGDRAQVVFGR